MNILFLVTGFASHVTWVEGYSRVCQGNDGANDSNSFGSDDGGGRGRHSVRTVIVPGDRWKFRMLCGGAELLQYVRDDDDIIVVDGMIEITVLMSGIQDRATRNTSQRRMPRVLVYMHENQITTPFVANDRDKKAQRQWQYGISHYRSLLVADGFVFNSQKHCNDFKEALPKVINEQSPRDCVEWHLENCKHHLDEKCVVLPYGLALQDLKSCVPIDTDGQLKDINLPSGQQCHIGPPTILWNARLEEDKDPGTFLELLRQVKQLKQQQQEEEGPELSPPSHSNQLPFRLIVLGNDPSKDQVWYERFKNEFENELLFIGFCSDRKDYARWLSQSDIVVSTAQHETFGISIVESVYMGALPLLPKRLSYPEIFPPSICENNIYKSTQDGVTRLRSLFDVIEKSGDELVNAKRAVWECAAKYDWSRMGSVYNDFFSRVGVGSQMHEIAEEMSSSRNMIGEENNTSNTVHLECRIMITDEDDDRIQLYRPKSLRDHKTFNKQMMDLRKEGLDPAVHGGRRAMVRMMEAIDTGSTSVKPLSFLTNQDLYETIFRQRMDDMSSPVYVAETQDVLNKIRGQKLNSGDSILALVSFPISSTLEEIMSNPPILILEDVRNAENVGSILRTAFCLGITSVVASPTAWSALKDTRAARCSMGTIYYHRFYRSDDDLSETIRNLKEMAGITVYGVEIGDRAIPVGPHGISTHWAAVMGNEDTGLSTTVAAACDRISFVPQAHGDSLNVGHAAAITMYELGRDNPIPVHDGMARCQ